MIRVRNLSKHYGSLVVLRDVNADISKGEVISVIGPSGTGKSTFLRCLNLLDKPTGGSIFIDEVPILDKTTNVPKIRQKMGMVFQGFNLYAHLSVLDNLTIGPIRLLGQDKAEAEAKARVEAEAKAVAAKLRAAQEAKNKKAKEEAEATAAKLRAAQEAKEKKAKEEAAATAAKLREAQEVKAKAEAEAKAKAEAAAKEKAKAEADAKAKADAAKMKTAAPKVATPTVVASSKPITIGKK